MAVDEATQAILNAMAAAGGPPVAELSIAQVRAGAAGVTALQTDAPALAATKDITIPGPAGRLPARVYIPERDGALPVVLFFHGGGWTSGDVEVIHRPMAKLAAEAGAIVVSAGYRLAPETQFPGAIDDASAILTWVSEHLSEFGGDPENLFVGGESSGATSATVAARRARDSGGPRLAGQLLVYPVTDSADAHYPSRVENGEGFGLTRATMDYNWDHYLPDRATRDHPDAAPIRADLAGMPPAIVLTMEYDPLRDEGEAYAAKLTDAGVRVRSRRHEGLIHGTFSATAAIPRSQELFDELTAFIRELSTTGGTPGAS